MHVTTLFIWFILYSALGWAFETIYKSVVGLKWDNRGMLLGPYCPIYGIGAVLDILFCGGLSKSAVFFICMFGSAILEYITSYATERLFHAVWWDYSRIPFNINGRVCLPCSIGFGAAGLIVLYGIHPYMAGLTNAIPLCWQEVIALVFMAVFSADCMLTLDSLVALNLKMETTIKAIDSHISEKYDAFIENTRHNISESLDSLKEKIPLEEFRERRMWEELKKTLSTMSWMQTRALRSSVSFRREKYSELGNKMKHTLLFRKKKGNSDTEESETEV
ncbi:MAG: putative ABC transporter permease [Muribaculaceae bacterium]|nr:putative ABC transporter permease [Roseburia sp.]MCM1431535.1 putative ABC transporter permease [Muribaculaceae bacterium]MCM1493828.1 putative ABC transporter permease [Muribaculaceae bacterium]